MNDYPIIKKWSPRIGTTAWSFQSAIWDIMDDLGLSREYDLADPLVDEFLEKLLALKPTPEPEVAE